MKSIREIFLPDKGEYFVKCDLSQIEDRMAKMYCNSERMRILANKPPWEYDAHTENSKAIFEKDNITKQERYLGKKVVHATWRKMGGVKMSESVSIDTDGKLFIPPSDCNKLIKTYLKANPEIEGYYFPFVEHKVRNEGILYSSWGRRYDVRCLRIDDDLLRRCYSFYPQAEDADWVNQYGLIPAYYYILKHYNKDISLQLHDEVVVSVPFTGIYDYCVFIKNSLEQTRKIQGHDLTVPVELKISKTFYGGIEFKQLPDKVSFEKHLIEYFEGEGKNG